MEGPSLQRPQGRFGTDDQHQLAQLGGPGPDVDLAEDGGGVGGDLRVGALQQRGAVAADGAEGVVRVQPALVQDGRDGYLEEVDDRGGRACVSAPYR